GGRCITHFANSLGILKGNKAKFIAIDGPHEANIKGHTVKLKMKNVDKIEVETKVEGKTKNRQRGNETPSPLGEGRNRASYVLNTGSPHYVEFASDVMHKDVYTSGKNIRNSAPFKKEGINVNFVQIAKGKTPLLRTYERGVEDETLSCGTGTVATALVLASQNKATSKDYCDIRTMGGDLKVWFTKAPKGGFKDVYLEGPATFVYKGKIKAK
ncbi:MAG TPA: diaminopimelate epimerase, partial [Bacteroidia bacterium]|nr:diaminopimelate epimerase [Bacteroidia bacterium]